MTSTANPADATAAPSQTTGPSQTTADVIVQSLISHGVDTVFGIRACRPTRCSTRCRDAESG